MTLGACPSGSAMPRSSPRVAEVVDGDPLPYGRSANRRGFEELIRLCCEQHILDMSVSVDELFPAFD